MTDPRLVAEISSLTRRLKAFAPEVRSVSFHGVPADAALKAASENGLSLVDGEADLSVIYRPGEENVHLTHAARFAQVAVCRSVVNSGECCRKNPARRYVSLREWVEGWFPENSRAGRFLAHRLVSQAVADRLTSAKYPGNSEWFAVADGGNVSRAGAGEAARLLTVTYFGTGLFPIMPATVACLGMAPLGLLTVWLMPALAFQLLWLAVTVAATWGCFVLEKWSARRFQSDDPKEFVLDEVAGLSLVWALLPAHTWAAVLWGVLAFRVFDIFKWGVKWVERRNWPGTIVWDDLVAALYAAAVVWLGYRVL
ncbi:MAG: phosphatidylglycerophosphatase A [Verrucomicrobia bacterium]|nr:phosphatidylglycerophosphatase A [Verrucomicrobiota bacterium]